MSAPETPAGFEHLHTGKVRDLYRTPEGLLLMVASDRISAADYVLPTPIPDKGRILTAITTWWFTQLHDTVPNHMIAVDDVRIPGRWRGRAMLCQPLQMLPVEAVARGYLAGSATSDYAATGAICGVRLPPGLVEGDRLPEPIFTPATKADFGQHDENVSFEDVATQIGAETAGRIRDLTLAVYARAAAIAAGRGLILADTKFEFGVASETVAVPSSDAPRLVLGDEVLTPDSSRYWPASQWKPGGSQPSFDKQFVRDWLSANWDRQGTPPELPDDIVAATRARYIEAYERLTGLEFDDWLRAE